MLELVNNLIESGWLKTPLIIESFRTIQRRDFLLDNLKRIADFDEALPIGWEQTISQPSVVAFMLEKLQPRIGEKILDIGSGSGWTTALLANIVGGKGRVIALEIIPELKEFGENNVAKYNFIKKGIVRFVEADGSKGYSKEAPFDKILCSAGTKTLPFAWKKQLKLGGKIVVPLGHSIWVFNKKSDHEFIREEYPGFVFVPLVSKESENK